MKQRKLLAIGISLLLMACSSTKPVTPITQSATEQKITPSQSTNTQQRPIKIALALGGGASKGFAHIGVINVLNENKIPIQIVTGTSAGAIVGSLYASGMTTKQLADEAEQLSKKDVADLSFSTKGFIVGKKLQDFINLKVQNKTIEQLPLSFAAVATDFDSGKAIHFNSGNTGQAVRASASIPNVFQPVQIGSHRYVDGGLSEPVPVSAARKLGADVVIAVDISARPKEQQKDAGFFSFLNQSLSIMSQAALQSELDKADIVIKPDVLSLGAVGGFNQKQQAIAAGEMATRAIIPQIHIAIQNKQQKLKNK
ncbi:MAG: patatin-like phospholipase family protein [Neisseriaceae bacterium]|nr:patatin-like phospholipase family protein [Neisseriaceae bacterium]